MSKQLRDHGSFIPGLRPGPRTAEYLETVVERITYVGAGFLAVIAIIPSIVAKQMNIPFFVAMIGGAVLLAILLAAVNTMLMAGREQTRDIGIMKALGFTDGSMFTLLILQALVLCGLGGGIGIGLALLTQGPIAGAIGYMFPGFAVEPATIAAAVTATIVVGLLAGIVPARSASRLRCVEALNAEE
jgi:ABC-type antimicrobial peptide transport system permease subunit